MDINVGDEITINGRITACQYMTCVFDRRANKLIPDGEPTLTVLLPSGDEIYISPADINTIHPYKEPSVVDQRKGN
jgi:hypothetical protein